MGSWPYTFVHLSWSHLMPLYNINPDSTTTKIRSSNFRSERSLQKLIEKNLESLIGVRFIASEFTTGDKHRGRIDTLGLDEDGSPTIIEYKKTSKENIINQGLFYLDWLVDHRGDFTMAAKEALGQDIDIIWSHPRLILIAQNFTRYDEYAVNRIGANIDLWVYRRYGENFLYMESIHGASVEDTVQVGGDSNLSGHELEDHLTGKSDEIKELFAALRDRIIQLDENDEITEKPLKTYIGYKHGINFCEVQIQTKLLKLWLDIPYSFLDDPYNIARDVTDLGHYGTGDVEVKVADYDELEKAMFLVEQAYQHTM